MSIVSSLLLLPLLGCDPSSKDLDGDGFVGAEDCDDDDAAVHPDADEVCDGIDNNCAGALDGGDATDATLWYADADGDGYGGDALTALGCAQPEGYLAELEDCDDLDASVNPDGSELCDGVDNDCDGLVDDDDDSVDLSSATLWYADGDGDGYGTDETVEACGQPEDYAPEGGDCDDEDADVSPANEWYADRDGDGYGDDETVETACEGPTGFIDVAGDCNDVDPAINPDATEVCGGEDEDCDGLVDDDDDSTDPSSRTDWYRDDDADGYGDEDGAAAAQCEAPESWVGNSDDCDDTSADVSPAETEICDDGVDNDCSGDSPECGIQGELDVSAADITITNTGSQYDYFGRSMAVADFDGDGSADVAASAYGYDGSAGNASGGVYVFSGPTTSIDASAADALLEGEDSSNYLGLAGLAAADFDQDGYDDLVMGAYGNDDAAANAGALYIAYGSASGTSSGSVDGLAQLTGNGSGDDLGYSVAYAGDIDGDTFPDFVAGAPFDDDEGSSSGSLFLVLGSGTRLSGTTNISSEAVAQWTGSDTYHYVGHIGSGGEAGDLDGDGFDELVIGAGDAYSDYGGVFLHYGSGTVGSGTIDDADAGFQGAALYGYFGDAWASTGDLDDDGYADMLVGAYLDDGGGTAYVLAGSTTAYSGEYEIVDAAWASFLGDTYYDSVGSSVAAGDLDGDGDDDLAIGAPLTDADGSNDGTIYVFYGPLSGGEQEAADADATIDGDECYLGYRGSLELYDVSGDGIDDVVVGGYQANSSYGAAYIFNGQGM